MQKKDMVGQIFDRLTVLSFAGIKGNYAHWNCICSCGKVPSPVNGSNLRKGTTRSCGCLMREISSARAKARSNRLSHGHARRRKHSLAYQSWASMKQRCLNPNHPDFNDYYGGRGAVRVQQAQVHPASGPTSL